MLQRFLLSLMMMSVVTSVRGETLIGLAEQVTGGQSLIQFDSATPALFSSVSVSGLASTEQLVGIDFRPLTGQLYGLSDKSAIYTLDWMTGAATKVGTGFTDMLNGGNFGFDFNPQIDRIRIVSDADQNFVAHPDTGNANVASTTPVAYGVGDANEGAQPNVVHHAYDGNVLGALAAGTQLRAIDTQLDILVTQANNAGTLMTIGSLGVDATDIGGFDVSTSGAAYAAFSNGVGAVDSTLYSIDLMTGAATALGTIPQTVWGLAAVPVPEPTGVLATAFAGMIGLMTARRRS
ncbi:MAG: DUF4394 domain-containing protein [Planctomycetales bacterium]|nr:DUF4394 domain-containing protein [Planctomycetales bacterium]MCA9166825.1 DUF4394 domain-containing protein [Planctomycetales bacterium]